MRASHRVLSGVGTVLTVAALALAGALLSAPAPAQAHNRVISTTPAAGATVTTLPESFQIVTDQNLLAIGGSTSAFLLDVTDASGRHFGDGCLTVVDATLSEDGVRLGAGGEYRVDWQIVSADGHAVSGSYSFTWAPPAGAEAAAGSATAQRCGEKSATTEQTAAPSHSDDQGRGAAVPLADLLWIGGAVLAVLVAGGVTLILVTRRRPGTESG